MDWKTHVQLGKQLKAQSEALYELLGQFNKTSKEQRRLKKALELNSKIRCELDNQVCASFKEPMAIYVYYGNFELPKNPR